jgi:hypothetical protein
MSDNHLDELEAFYKEGAATKFRYDDDDDDEVEGGIDTVLASTEKI